MFGTVYLGNSELITTFCALLARSSAIAVIADRTACSILTLFIVSTTSRSLNKKSVCCQSANPINNTADLRPQIRSPHTSLHVQSAQASAVAPNGTVSLMTSRLAALERHNCVLGLRFVARAVRFLRCILWLNDTFYSKSVKRDK